MKDMTMFTNKQLEVMAEQGDARSVHAKRELEKRNKDGKGRQGLVKDKYVNSEVETTSRKTRKVTTKATDKKDND